MVDLLTMCALTCTLVHLLYLCLPAHSRFRRNDGCIPWLSQAKYQNLTWYEARDAEAISAVSSDVL